MFVLKRNLSLILVFNVTIILGSSTKTQNGHGEPMYSFREELNSSRLDFLTENDKKISSPGFPSDNKEIHSTTQSLETDHTNVNNTETNFETISRSNNLNTHTQSQELKEKPTGGSTAQFTSAKLFESTNSDSGSETISESPEANEIDSTTHAIKQSKETATVTRIVNGVSSVLATITKSVTSTVPQDISSAGVSTPLNVTALRNKLHLKTHMSVVKVSKPASKLSSVRKGIETSARTTTWGAIISSTARHQTKSSELSFKKNGGEIEEPVTDGRDLVLKENKTSQNVRPIIPCDFTRHGNYYDSTSLIAAAVGGAFVGGVLVLAAFYCKQRFYTYLRGDYRRVPMEYDFELNPRLKGGPSEFGTKILQKYKNIVLILPKLYNFHS